MCENFGIILLAAGSSTRMGQSKQLLEINGEPLLRKSLRAALTSAIKKIVVVLGAYEKEHRALIGNSPVNIIKNSSWEKGMGSSFKAGLNYLLQSNPKLTGVVVLVCDQPLLEAKHINNLIKIHHQTKKPIVAAEYAQTAGVPAFFEKKYFQQLLSLSDAEGAKKIIHHHAEDLSTMDFPEGEFDMDTPDDYQTFKRRNIKP